MPLSRYYSGNGDEVMRRMKARYGAKEGERVFYATAKAPKLKVRGRAASFAPPGGPLGSDGLPYKRGGWDVRAGMDEQDQQRRARTRPIPNAKIRRRLHNA